MDDIKISSNRSFGIVFFVVFLLIALYPLIHNEEIRIWSLIISLIFLILGLINSRILKPLNKLWMYFGFLLGVIISPIVLGVIYFGLFTPIAVLMRMAGRDELKLKSKPRKSYWIQRESSDFSEEKFKNQF